MKLTQYTKESLLADCFLMRTEILQVLDKPYVAKWGDKTQLGDRGLSPISLCLALGFSGAVCEVYDAIESLKKDDLIKTGYNWTDRIYFL